MSVATATPIELFRISLSRVATALAALTALFVLPHEYNHLLSESMEMAGFVLLIVAVLGRIWCSLYIAGRKDRELCTDGPYSLSRNPLYFFSFLGVVGFAMSLRNLPLLIAVALLFLGYYHFVIKSEEQRLETLFGQSFRDYCQHTPRFLPALRAIAPIRERRVYPKIIERSLRDVVWFLLVIVLVESLESLHEAGHLVLAQAPF